MQQPIHGHGLCECGCGQATTIARFTRPSRGTVRGQPTRFVTGHRAETGPAAFWALIHAAMRPGDACWEWTGFRLPDGYGCFGLSRVHRVMFEHATGPIPDGIHVCHTCDNPPCCNPAHLFAGTRDDNMADMAAKGRSRTAGGWKLTASDVAQIRARRAAGERQSDLAREFGISRPVVSQIVHRKIWK